MLISSIKASSTQDLVFLEWNDSVITTGMWIYILAPKLWTCFFFAGRRSMVIQCKVASSAQLGPKKYVMFGVGAVHNIIYDPL